MVIFESKAQVAEAIADLQASGGKTGFISVLGLLHEGHQAQIRKAKEMADAVIVMVFANPMVVSDPEVKARFAAGRAADRERLEAEGVDYAYFADAGEVFSPSHRTYVSCERLFKQFQDIEPAGYLRGLATALFQMLNTFRPAFFIIGQKNYLDYLLLKRIVRDFNYSTEVVLTPAVRDESGMAYTAFNTLFSPEERKAAQHLSEALLKCREMLLGGEMSVKAILRALQGKLAEVEIIKPVFTGVLDPVTAEHLDRIQQDALVMVTARVGRFRVTDNILYKKKAD